MKGPMAFVCAAMLSSAVLAADFDKGVACAEAGDYQCAYNEWRPLAEQGDANAQYMLGLIYNKGVKQNKFEAVRWFLLAAEQGDVGARFMLGVAYNLGQGVKQNDLEAVKWYRLAAEQGDASAQQMLGLAYDLGVGVKQNKAVAKQWYGKACDNQNQKGCDKYRELNEAGY